MSLTLTGHFERTICELPGVWRNFPGDLTLNQTQVRQSSQLRKGKIPPYRNLTGKTRNFPFRSSLRGLRRLCLNHSFIYHYIWYPWKTLPRTTKTMTLSPQVWELIPDLSLSKCYLSFIISTTLQRRLQSNPVSNEYRTFK